MKKKIFLTLSVLVLLTTIGEVVLRTNYGFCHSPLAVASNKYEYIYQANQDLMRFGNHVHYNSENMRSEEVNPNAFKILGLGDSVLNGGVPSDQDSLATSLLSNELSQTTGQAVQVLNISAGSWGPDNCAAYLKERGLFNAKLMLLVVSSHDAHDNMDFQPVVGTHPSYPDHQYFSALWEVWDRYVWPRYIKAKLLKGEQPKSQAELEIRKAGREFNPGFEQLYEISQADSISLIIYLHAEQEEVKQGKYNDQGQEILAFAQQHQIRVIRELDYGTDSSWYRDGIHLNNKGQREMANILRPVLEEAIGEEIAGK